MIDILNATKPIFTPMKHINRRAQFEIHLGEKTPEGLKKGRLVGLGFLREGKHEYKLKIFSWSGARYYLRPVDKFAGTYTVWVREEIRMRRNEPNVYWSEVGDAKVNATLGVMEIKLDLCHLPVYMSLFPMEKVVPKTGPSIAKLGELKLIS
jgi:hypothetical protein